MSPADWLAERPLIGMIHLLPLPGAPRYTDLSAVRERARDDAAKLVAAGFRNLMLENYGDVPFYPDRVPAETVASMAALATELRGLFPQVRWGVNVLRNDGRGALAVAVAADAHFIRVNVLSGARLTDQGIVSGIAHDLLRLRRQLDSRVLILADVDVKHSRPLAPVDLEDEVRDLTERGLADAVIVSGPATGQPVETGDLRRVKRVTSVPVLVGSGATIDNVESLLAHADGLIVGSAVKRNGRAELPVEENRAAEFVRTASEVTKGREEGEQKKTKAAKK